MPPTSTTSMSRRAPALRHMPEAVAAPTAVRQTDCQRNDRAPASALRRPPSLDSRPRHGADRHHPAARTHRVFPFVFGLAEHCAAGACLWHDDAPLREWLPQWTIS